MRIITNATERMHIETLIENGRLKAQLDAEVNRRERAELDLMKLQDDFKGLVALTAGRIPPKLAPEFTKDLWAEDKNLPETFLTPAEEELGMSDAGENS